MKDLEKNVNYDLTNCTDDQLEKICEWLKVNDSSWNKRELELIVVRTIYKIGWLKYCNGFINMKDSKEITICATTLFESQTDNFDTAYNETIERFKKLGYSIDIIIKGYDLR